MSDTENEDTPEWQDEDVLEGHVDEGLTYDEIAERYEDATPYQVGKFVRRYDITPVHNRPKYQDGEVPVRLIDGMNVEHPIPVDVAEKYGIDDGTPLRYIADPDVMDLSVIIETGDHVTGDLSNERRATKRGTTYPTARYPMTLGHAFGLVDQFSTADAATTSLRMKLVGSRRMPSSAAASSAVTPWTKTKAMASSGVKVTTASRRASRR